MHNNIYPISSENPVAYFSAEYGIDKNLPIYAGGLGILSGDTIKQAADSNIPFIGIGLLYRGQNMRQRIDETGMQVDEDWQYDPVALGVEHVYVNDMPLFVKVHLTEVEVWLRCWKKTFHNGVVLYLLDSETEQNEITERPLTQILYSGTQELQVKQQLLLGVGGVKLLTELGIYPSIFHVNEGRPAFLHWQLIRELMNVHGLSYQAAKSLARQKTVYTNHTLVAAGNQGYPMEIVKPFSEYYSQAMGISNDILLSDGIEENPDVFSMTTFALNTSRKANGVSTLHSELSQERWPLYHWTSVTNGVHFPTWQSANIESNRASAKGLWDAHMENKRALADFTQSHTGFSYDPNRLVVCWARRVAGYKQLPKLFADIERLAKIIKHENRPIQILIAGKAHHGDKQGKIDLQNIIVHMGQELSGNVLFLPNYNIEIAQNLVKGSDVWINIPEPGKEACGTSGMKAASNGVLQCQILDGWSTEVDWNNTGWVLDPLTLTESLYSTLEHKIAPLYYNRDSSGIPYHWIEMMQRTIDMSHNYTSERMMNEYVDKLYSE